MGGMVTTSRIIAPHDIEEMIILLLVLSFLFFLWYIGLFMSGD